MDTLLSLLFLMIIGLVASSLGLYVINIAGMLGPIVSGRIYERSKTREFLGIAVSTFCQTYVYLLYVSYLISWTIKTNKSGEVNETILWIATFLFATGPIAKLAMGAEAEEKESSTGNVQVKALKVSQWVAIIAFFLFVFKPEIMSYLYSYVLNVAL